MKTIDNYLSINTNKKMSDLLQHIDDLQKFPNFVIFQTSDRKVNIDVYFKDETLWLNKN